MKRTVTYLSTLLLALSCISNPPTSEIKALFPLQSREIATAEVPSIIEDMRSVKLSNDLFLSFIKRVVIAPNGDLVLCDKNGVYQFSSEGDYIRTIGSKGRSKREYISIDDICVDYTTNSLLILDESSKVLFYSLEDGMFVKSVKVEEKGRALRVDAIAAGVKDGFFIVSCSMNSRDEATLEPAIYEFDCDGELVGKHVEVKDCMITMSLVSQSCGNSYIVRPFDNENIINKIEDGVISPYYRVDFEGQGAKAGSIYGSDGSIDIRGYMASNSYKYPSMIVESEDYISMMVAGPEFSAMTTLFNKRTNQSYRFAAPDGRTIPTNPIVADDQYLYYLYTKSSSDGVEERADPLTKHFIERYGYLNAEDNPMLIGVKYRF